MKKFLLIICFLLIQTGFALAADNSVKLKYQPGLVSSGRFVEVSVNGMGPDELAAKVFEKLKALETLGRLDYLVPDAQSIAIEVTYNGVTIRSANSLYVPKPAEYAEYDRLWKEAYNLVWTALEEDLKLKQP